jgi:predicted P-loop ATPase
VKSGSDVTSADYDTHARLGIPRELLTRARVCRLDDHDARHALSVNGKAGDFAGLWYPYFHPQTNRPVTGRLRRDHPPLDASGKPEAKYLAPFGDNRHLYFPPDCAEHLADTSMMVAIAESEKAALAILAAAARAGRRILPIALGGCWSWRGVIGKTEDATGQRGDVKGTLPDFSLVTWDARPTVILFDANPNDSVRAARRQLARELRDRGAVVRHGHLPDDDHRINGPDDLVAVRGDDALWRVIDGATAEDFLRHPEKGHILADSLDNLRLALTRFAIRLAYDEFRRVVLVNGSPLDDVRLDRLIIDIDDHFHFRASEETLHRLLVADAHRATLHPVREYLAGLSWDGTPRLDRWLIDYGGAEDSAYVRAVGALPLLAAVRRVRTPGSKFDELAILESEQGTLKSSALRTLCPRDEWFSDDLPLGVDAKQVIERTTGRWLLEASELHGNRGKEAEALKAFLSRQVDGPCRLAYARDSVSVPRQFVMIGTTNATTSYLKDWSGGRRFWPVRIQRFDLASLRQDRDQLWAEAAARESAGESIRLEESLWPVASEAQEARRATDPWEAILEPLLDGDDLVRTTRVTVADIWEALKLEASHLDNRHADRVAAILQRYGYSEKKRLRVNGTPMRCWVRQDHQEE